MSNIDKLMEKLKSAALKLNCEQWQTRNGFSGVEVIVKGSVAKGHGCVSYQPVASELVDTKTAKAIALFCPANILALLDELEAAKQDASKWFKAFEKAVSVGARYEEQIAELEAREVVLPQPAQWDISEVLLDKAKVLKAIRDAGITVKGE
ncbi:ead/Ea22-like family protein [Enterobacter cancerogenus]|jgi:hypothetical protein